MLPYSLISTAISDDRRKLRGGMRLLAEIAHKHGIPITWAIDGASARPLANDLTQWRESHGDGLLLMLDIAPIWGETPDFGDAQQAAEHIVTMREKLPDYIRSEWAKVERAMPWATPTVAGAAQKNHVLLYALEQVGFKGLWGYRWETDDDRGCPFGCFYPSVDRHNFAGQPASSVVGIPYTSVELTQKPDKSNPTPTAPEITPNAPLDGEFALAALQLETLNRRFDRYAANLKWNEWLAYIQHINAEDLTLLTPDRLEGLDAHFTHLSEQNDTQFVRLSEVVNGYQTHTDGTSPTFLLVDTDDKGEQPKLFYYDQVCQMVFEADKMEPIEMKNYITPPVESRHGAEYSLPQLERFRPSRSRDKLQMQFSLESAKAMPYGFAVWGSHLGLRLAKSNARSVTWLDDRLLFIRIDLEAGANEIEVVLTI
jgi:hypothetical protein